MAVENRIRSSVPVSATGPIDWRHLERTSFGDPALVREVLGMFTAQTAQLVGAISGPTPDAAASAHKLKGSAQAIGAWSVAEAADRLDAALMAGAGGAAEAVAALTSRIDETCRAIEQYLSQGR